jgi:hypothetical protein
MSSYLVVEEDGKPCKPKVVGELAEKPARKIKTQDTAPDRELQHVLDRMDHLIQMLEKAAEKPRRHKVTEATARPAQDSESLIAQVNAVRDAARQPFHQKLRELSAAYDSFAEASDAGQSYADACRQAGLEMQNQEYYRPRESFEQTLRRFRGNTRTNARANDADAEDFAATCNRRGRELRDKKK